MSARAIVAGVLFKAAASKVSKAGKPFAMATIREQSGDAVRWWRCFVFGERALAEILRLDEGEPIAVAGVFDCELYAPAGGEARLSWKIVGDEILTARRKPKPKGPATRPAPGAPLFDGRRPPIDDDIPF